VAVPMSYRYASGDEAGQTGFKFEKGSTPLFLVTLLLTNDPSTIREHINRLRVRLGVTDHAEFRFHSTPHAHRLAFLSTLATCDLAVRALFVDKRVLPAEFRRMKSWDFYAFFVCELLDRLPVGELDGTILYLDDFGPRKVTIRALRQRLKQIGLINPKANPLKRIAFKRSRGEMLIQAADMVAGAVYRWLNKGNSVYFDLIRSKALVWEYRAGKNPPT